MKTKNEITENDNAKEWKKKKFLKKNEEPLDNI